MDSSEDASGQSTPTIPIAQINPAFDRLAESSIRAAVTLVWPYSPSTKSFSVLLAEPDVRLRRSNGQVKVTFHALVAERIAETHVGIGDEVVLELAGCRLEENGTATQTPSRYVAWDVHFDDRVHIEISRALQHHATVKIDPPLESQRPPEPVNETPVTPVPNRRRPDDIDTEPGFGAWTSPAFFQRSHASFGGLVDSSVDPFAEEDGFIPGRGRKRPRFSMRSSEWRVVDEPASPGEKASPVDWTEELEAEVDEDEKVAENTEAPQESPEPTSGLPDTQEGLSGASFDSRMASTDQLAPETGPTIEEPVQPLTPTPASGVNGKEDLASSLQIPVGSPHLRPVPSPGLPIPSPLGSSTPENGYFTSGFAPTSQPSTTVTQSQETIGDHGISVVQAETVQTGFEDSNLDRGESIAFSGHTGPVEPKLQTMIDVTEQIPEDVYSEEEEEEEEATAASSDAIYPSLGQKSPVKDIPHEEVPGDHSDDVEMIDEDEDEDENRDKEEEEYSEEEMEQADQKPELSVEISQQGSPESADGDAAESPQVKAEEPEEISEDEEEEEDQQDESMDEAESDEYESEYGYENRPEEEIVDSEMESDEDEEEEEEPSGVPTRPPPSNIQPDVIVLDSDDEDEQPAGPQVQQPQPQPQSERESEDAEQHALSPAEDRGDWPSDDENEMGDELMAERRSDEEDEEDESESDGSDEPEDKHSRDELVEVEAEEDEGGDEEVNEEDEDENEEEEEEDEGEEEDEDEEYENEEEEDGEESAEDQPGRRLPGEQPEQISLLNDDETGEQSEDELAQDTRVEEDEDEKEDEADVQVQEQSKEPEDDQRVEDKAEEEENLAQTEARAEVHTVENDTSKDESKDEEHMEVVEEKNPDPEVLEHEQTGQDDKQEVELVDRTGRVEDHPDEDRPDAYKPDEEKPDESDADSQDEFVEPLEFLAAPEGPPVASEPALHQLDREQQLESTAGLVYDGAASPPGEWYDAPTDVNESASVSTSEQQDDEPSQQLAAEYEQQQLHALAEVGGTTPAIEITGTPEPEPESMPRTPSIKQEENENEHEHGSTGLRSKYSYFAPLASLPDHFNTLTDTITIIHDASPITQAQSGPRDYILTLHLTDHSMAGTTVLAHLARPYSEALPQNPREGDALLLRNFKPKPSNRAMSLVSDDTSSWAVLPTDNPNEDLVPGPPVEYGVEERSYASGLRHWYRYEGGAALVADVSLQASIDYDQEGDEEEDHDLSITSLSPSPSSNASVSGSGSGGSEIDNLDAQNLGLGLTSGGLVARRSLLRRADRRRRRRRDSQRRGRRITIHELRDGRRYTEVGSPSGQESIHELRDGTVYANL